ncbi:MAG: PEP-CTERM sorting domain-containing protein [Planctomycetota bacterium]
MKSITFGQTLTFLIICLGASTAQGATFYSLVFDQPFASLSAQQTRRLSVFLEETSTDPGDVTLLGAGDAGLLQSSFRVERSGIGGASITAAAFSPNPSVSPAQSSAVVGPPTVILNTVTTLAPLRGTPSGPGVSRLLLGTVDVTAGSTFGEPTVFTLGLGNDPLGPDFVAADATVLDNRISFGTFSTVTAVPEPNTLAAIGVLGTGCWMVRRRRRKAASH